ncbi:MAG: protein kinase [Duncaniella sp.]|nr:protein kinase [Duncaniella sp.]
MVPTADIPESLMTEGEVYSGESGVELISRRSHRMIWLTVRDGRRLVLKGLPEHLRSHPEEVASLRKEYLLGLRVEAEGVVRVYGYHDHPLLGPVIEMEYIDGKRLNEYLASGEYPGLPERLGIARKIAQALAAVHRAGVSHRDLKPDNILVTPVGMQPKIIDFSHGDAGEFVIYKHSAATEQYGAPEQQSPSRGDMASDVYSFGKILDELLPERGYRRLRSACKAHDPVRRPDMEQVVRRLEKTAASHRTAAVIAAVIALCVIVAVISGYLRRTPADTPAPPPVIINNTPELPEHDGVAEEPERENVVPVRNNPEANAAAGEDDFDAVVRKYIRESDEINSRYGAIEYDREWNPELQKEKTGRRLARGDEQNKLADRMERELQALGAGERQRDEAKHILWTHIVMETNRIDGADKIRDSIIKNYTVPSVPE